MPIGRVIRPYSRKIQAESDVKKPSRPLRPCFRFSIRLKLLFASRFILSRQEKVFSPAIDDDTRFLRIFLHLRRFQRSLPMFSTFPHISFHEQTITPPPLNAFCTYKKSEALASPRNPALSALFFSLSRFPDPTISLSLNRL